MGVSAFFYYPEGADRMQGVNLRDRINGRDGPYVSYKSSVSTSMGGTRATRIYAGVERINIRRTIMRGVPDRTGDTDLTIRKLRGMIAHLKRGGSVTFFEDLSTATAAFVTVQIAVGADSIQLGERITIDLAGTNSFVGREIIVRSDPDRLLLEERLCDSFTNGVAQLDTPLSEDWSTSRWILARDSGTYPALRLPEDALGRDDFLQHTDDLTYELEIPLEDDIDGLEKLARIGGQIGSELPAPTGQGIPPGDFRPGEFDPPKYWSW